MAKVGKHGLDEPTLEGGIGGGGGMGRGSSLQMKHQRDTYGPTNNFGTPINRRPDTSNSLAERSRVEAEVPNVTKSIDGHPTVKYNFNDKAGASRVEPTITPTSVKKIESDIPIPKSLLKDVEPEGMAKGGSASSRADGIAQKGKTKGRMC